MTLFILELARREGLPLATLNAQLRVLRHVPRPTLSMSRSWFICFCAGSNYTPRLDAAAPRECSKFAGNSQITPDLKTEKWVDG
jgi:hypothetical protein